MCAYVGGTNAHVQMWAFLWAHVCGGHRTSLCVIPQELNPFFIFVPGSLKSLELTRLSWAGHSKPRKSPCLHLLSSRITSPHHPCHHAWLFWGWWWCEFMFSCSPKKHFKDRAAPPSAFSFSLEEKPDFDNVQFFLFFFSLAVAIFSHY